jgi:hypothetical protein
MASILSTYTKKSDYLEKIDSKIKEEVKLDTKGLTGEIDTSIKAVILAENKVYADNVASEYVTSATGIDFTTKATLTNGQGLYTNNKLEDGSNTYFRGASFCAYTNYTSESSSGTNCIASGGTWSNRTCSLNLNRSACISSGFTYYDLKNNVNFAGHNWRIIRIDENDNIRMILADTSAPNCGEYNATRTDNAHVGYMFGTVPSTTYVNAHTNTNNSTTKACIDTWYVNNLASYSSYIADAGYCCDRSLTSGSGYGTIDSYYGAFSRSSAPKLNLNSWCSNATRDLFTTTSSSIGNKKLANPIGLITYDEARYAGISGSQNFFNYLGFGANYWTMTPSQFSSPNAFNYCITQLNQTLSSSYGQINTRPVISLKSTVNVSSGIGTFDNPFVVN